MICAKQMKDVNILEINVNQCKKENLKLKKDLQY